MKRQNNNNRKTIYRAATAPYICMYVCVCIYVCTILSFGDHYICLAELSFRKAHVVRAG